MKHAGLLVAVVAAVTLEVTSLIQFYFSQKGIKEEAAARAQSELTIAQCRIMDVIDQTESAVRNGKWIAVWSLDYPDSLSSVCRRIVSYNPVVMGSAAAMVPDYLRKQSLFCPYAYRDSSDRLVLSTLATPEYDYPSWEWFRKPIETDQEYWSEPYVDDVAGILMTTFSVPIWDRNGKKAMVLTADISLDWINGMLKEKSIYPNAFTFMLSRGGNVMVRPEGTPSMRRTSDEYLSLKELMMSGETGSMEAVFKGEESVVFYAPVERTGWSMAIVVPKNDIYGKLRRMGGLIILLQLLGLAMMIVILRASIKGQQKFNELERNRARMQSELNVASGIQMSMVPKVFPAFPERKDLDMAAAIVPAKEVGGDLYDYFIRDEKLFFCIGDVSGKGVPASLVMAVTRTTFRNVAAKENKPGVIVKTMNDNLSSMNDSEMFVTFFCGVLDLANGHLHYCNAGHNPPMILTDDIRMLPVEPNLPLGIMGGMPFKEQETVFNYDDALFLYTDGLTEAENIDHELFGEERTEEALRGRKPSDEHLHQVKAKVAGFVGEAPQSDDLTMLFIHYLGHPQSAK